MKKGLLLTCFLLLIMGIPNLGFAAIFGPSLLDNGTGQNDSYFLGAPDDNFWGLGSTTVTYDFGQHRVVDGSGSDFNVYEVDYGSVEFHLMTVSVSLDGITFVDVKTSEASGVRIPGDSVHGNNSYFRSYDLFGTGLIAAQYIRIVGLGSNPNPGHTTDFDLDAVGLIHHSTVPIPGAIFLLGSGLLGIAGVKRRSSLGRNPRSQGCEGRI